VRSHFPIHKLEDNSSLANKDDRNIKIQNTPPSSFTQQQQKNNKNGFDVLWLSKQEITNVMSMQCAPNKSQGCVLLIYINKAVLKKHLLIIVSRAHSLTLKLH
jgi:hypothetical protein